MNSRKLAKEGLVITHKKPFLWAVAFYDAVEPPKTSHKEALEILNNQEEWEKLNLGQKLNVAKVYAYGVAEELEIEVPPIHLVRYKSIRAQHLFAANALSIKDGIVISINNMKLSANVLNDVAHELKHIHQFYGIDDDYKYKLKTLPSEEVINIWKESNIKAKDGTMKYSIGERAALLLHATIPTEVDANEFAKKYILKVFGEEIPHCGRYRTYKKILV